MLSNSTLEARPVAPALHLGSGGRALSRLFARPSVFLFVILAAQLMVTLDGTVVNVALPHIQHSLGFSSAGLSWVLNAYVLSFGGLLLLGTRSADLIGRRRTFLAGIALSSLAGGFATSAGMFLAARAAQGVGAALAAPSSLALLTTVFAEETERVKAIGLFTTVSAAGVATGRLGHDEQVSPAPRGRIPKDTTVKQRMARRLRTKAGKTDYARRKAIVEPAFGQMKTRQHAGQLRLRGLAGAQGEWNLHMICHNLRKLANAGGSAAIATV